MKTSINLRQSIEKLILSLEDNNDGKNRIEREFVYFLKMENVIPTLKGKSSDIELQEQYEIKIPKVSDSIYTSRIRVRERIEYKNSVEGTPEYIICIKANRDGVQGTIENELTATKEMFELFKAIAVYGMKKIRCTIPIKNTQLFWEVDIMMNSDGSFNPWVKIDLEVPSHYDGEVPNVLQHFESSDSVVSQWNERTEEENQKCKMILDSFKYREIGEE